MARLLDRTRVDTKLTLIVLDDELRASLRTDEASSSTKGRSQSSVSALQRDWDQLKTSTDAAREPAVAASVTNLPACLS